MDVSQNGLAFIQKHEGFSLEWYELNDGGLTVGYGHYVPHASARQQGIKKGDKITKEQANKFLEQDIKRFSNGVTKMLNEYGFIVNQNQFDVLVSYAYNRGLGNAQGTNGLRQLLKNSKSVQDIYNNLPVYWGSNEHYKKGLINRRLAEQKLFGESVAAKEDNKIEFSSATLKRMYEERIVSRETMKLLDGQAVEILKHTTKLKDGQLMVGDMLAIAIELAVHYSKINKG